VERLKLLELNHSENVLNVATRLNGLNDHVPTVARFSLRLIRQYLWRSLVPVAFLIENRGASLLLKKSASGSFKFPKNDLNDLNGWNVGNGHRF
jgi:hypothetical protein